jgi:hypothetical protein
MERDKNYKLYFINYKKRADHVDYIIRLNCLEDSRLFAEFSERYSTLKDLHDALKKETNSSNFPKFPPKKFFGNTDEKFLNKRQTDLQHYFNDILSSREFRQLPSLKAWLDNIINRYAVRSGVEDNSRQTGNTTNTQPERVDTVTSTQPVITSTNPPIDRGNIRKPPSTQINSEIGKSILIL